jgi:hypothetical protein
VQKISVIFPMAGQGARFGYRFKPFLDVRGRSFIEAAFAPFRPWLAQIDKVYFVFTAEQDRTHDVRARLKAMFADVPHETAVLDGPTDGPAETLRQCLTMKAVTGPVIVCDCDHAVNVDGLMQMADGRPEIACAIPTWTLEGESLAAWSVAAVDQGGLIAAVAEKSLPAQGENFRGMIGCYYFADAAAAECCITDAKMTYISDLIAAYLRSGRPVLSVPVREAHFFGDPARLAQVVGA